MIPGAVVHIDGELPIVVDLRTLPEPSHVTLVCTNMRTVDGKKPAFIERRDSWFVIPMAVVRFVELPASAVELAAQGLDAAEWTVPVAEATEPEVVMLPAPAEDVDLEPDAAFLARIRDI